MIEKTGVLRFPGETVERIRVIEQSRVHDLDRATSAHADVFGQIDGPHSTLPQPINDMVPVSDDPPDQTVGGGYGPERGAVVGTQPKSRTERLVTPGTNLLG